MRRYLYTGLVIIIIGLALIDAGNAATMWVNPTNTGTQNGLTKATGYTSLHAVMESHMVSGDTVIIANGDWSAMVSMGISSDGHMPPHGIDNSHMTTIQAETDWGVKLHRLDCLNGSNSYITIQGIIFPGGTLYHWDYSKIIRCGFFRGKVTSNNTNFDLFGCYYNLVEECIGWGGGRYTFIDYHGGNNIFRRCVARHDWYISPEWIGQESNFMCYGSDYTIYQNCISIDSDRDEYYTHNSENNDFWAGNQDGGGVGNIYDGCISMKGNYKAYYFGGDNDPIANIIMENCIALGPYLEGVIGETGGIIYGFDNLVISNCLFYDLDTGNQTLTTYLKSSDGSVNMTNSIVRDVGAVGANGTPTLDYMYYYNVATGNYGAHSTKADPFTNGLRYPVRIEAGSALATAGSGGTVCGPTILKKIGVSGTSYGETGWDQVTNEDLWPFPNEDKIKELMSVTVEGVPGIYGFTAYNSPFGSPNTLTSYIWEYFGNKIPPEIYGADAPPPAADTTKPATITNLAATSGTNPGTVNLSWSATGDDGNVGTATLYIIKYSGSPITSSNWSSATDVSGEPSPKPAGTAESFTVTGLIGGQTYYFAIRAQDEAGNISDVFNSPSAIATAVLLGQPGPPIHVGI